MISLSGMSLNSNTTSLHLTQKNFSKNEIISYALIQNLPFQGQRLTGSLNDARNCQNDIHHH